MSSAASTPVSPPLTTQLASLVRGRRELLLAAVVLLACIVLAIANPTFLSAAHLFGLGRSSAVIGIMALGVLLVLLTGGIDVSVSAIAVSAMYLTVVTLRVLDFQGTFLVAVALSILIGALLGLVNGVLVAWLKLPSMIVTIGTLTLYRGALLAFVGTERIRQLPAQIGDFSTSSLITTESAGRTVSLHTAVLVFAILAVLLAVVLKRVWWGRFVYAIGDDEEAAARMGVPVHLIRTCTFVISGALAGLAGILYAGMNRAADPSTFSGVELTVLAAVVLGGAAVTGGRGTVLGTVLGVVLITVVGSSLVLIGIPAEWQSLFIGLFVLLGVCAPAIRDRRLERRRGMVVSE
ncbi:MAG: ABC transporter permease [Dermabacter sp.]|nr:ABC transporter permease [Dermabacter sp.]